MRPEPATLPDVLAALKRAKFFLATGVLAGVCGAMIFLSAAVPSYRAQMIAGPTQTLEAAGERALPESPSLNDLGFTRFETIITGISVASALLKDTKIFQGLQRDPRGGIFEPDQEWTPEKLSEYLKRRIRIEPIGDTKLRRLVYYHPSADFAVYMLGRIHRAADVIIREDARVQAAQRVGYLRKTSAEISNPEHRRALTDLLVQQERLLMLASIDQPFAAAIVEPPSASARPRWPDKSLALAAFAVAGALAGFVVYGLRAV